MSLSARDDDMALLTDLSRRTGLGFLRHVPARATSNPQVRWDIVSHPECLRLAAILAEFPLRGRKRREVTVWSHALHDLVDEPRPAALPFAAAELRTLRRYVDARTRVREPLAIPPDALPPYLGGFFTGEGHLSISRRRCRTFVKVREDDRGLLEALAAETGLGSVYVTAAYRSSRPAAVWVIHRRDQLARAVRLLESAGLRGRKLREFQVWRDAALDDGKPASRRSHELIDRAATRLAAARTYRGPSVAVLEAPRQEQQRHAFVDVLKQTALITNGALTARTYATARRRNTEWPTRNTIASAFGSWAAALEAAGLRDRCSARARSRSSRGAARLHR